MVNFSKDAAHFFNALSVPKVLEPIHDTKFYKLQYLNKISVFTVVGVSVEMPTTESRK